MNGAHIRLEDVVRRFQPDGAPAVDVLRSVDLDVAPGESVAIVGPSGAGKSTLLHLIAGLDRPDAGAVMVDGRNLAGLDEAARTALRGGTIGLVLQNHHLLPQLTVLENALVPAWAAGGDTAAVRATTERLLVRVGLEARRAHRPAQLSGGECQRVALVRALVRGPRLLLADEPTGSLDRAGATALADLLVALNREEGVTLIAVTHAEDFSARLSRRLLLRDGTLHPA